MEGAAWGAVGAFVALVVREFVSAVLRIKQANWEQTKGERRDVLDEYAQLIETLQTRQKEHKAELQEQRKEIVEVNKRLAAKDKEHMECERNHARAVARIEALEDALTANGIKFRPYRGTGDSDTHTPLSQ